MRRENQRIYMLRMRKLMNGNRPKWIFTVSLPNSDQPQHFASIGALNLFLEQEMDAQDAIQMRSEP